MKLKSPLLHPAHLVAALAFTALLAVSGHTSAATVFWDGNLSTTWDTSAQNWKTLASGGTSTAFTTNDTVTFGVTSPSTQTVVVTSGGVSTGLFTISSGTAWNFSGGNITAFNETTQNSIGNATTFTDMSVNLTRNGTTGTSVGVTITANVTLTSSTAKISTWRGPLAGFSLTTGKTLTLAGSAILDANKILAKSGLLGTIIINDNAVLKGAAFGSSNTAGTFLQPIDLNGGTLTATTLTSAGGGVAITWSGGVIRPTTTAGISYGTNANGVVNTIVLDGAGGGTFNGLDYNTNTVSTITIDNAITESGGSYGVTLTGGGNLTLNGNNTYTGTTTINAGTLAIGSTGLLGGGNYSQNITNNGTFLFGSNSNQTLGGIISGSGALTKNGTGTLTLSGNNTYSGATTISAGTLVIGSTGLLGGGNYSQSIANNGAFLFGSNSNQTLGGIISGTGALTKDGTGTLTLSGNNTYSGTTTISAGTLVIGSTGLLGSGNYSQSIANSDTFLFGSNSNQTLGGIISGSGALTKDGSGALALSGNNTYTGTTTISAGTLQANHANALGSGGNITFTSGTLQYTANSNATDWGARFKNSTSAIALDTNSTNVTLSAAIDATNTGGLTKLAAGTLTLSGNNTYSGATTISAGTLVITSTGLLGGGNYSQSIANSGTFLFSSNSNQTLGGIISGSGALNKDGTGTLTLSGNNTYSGATTISAGTLVIGSTGLLGGGNYSQSIANSDTFLLGSNGNQTLGGIISGSGALTKDGSGTLTLSGNNTYTGTTTISAGTLQANHANALGSGGNITFTSGTLQYTANSNATDWGARFKNSTAAIALDTNSTNVTLSAAIDATNTGGLTKLAAGTLTLSGNNTYSGATTISAGTLVITSTGLLGGGSYSQSIANSGTFLFGSNSNQTLGGNISGSGALTKNGTGMLTLSGNNSGTGGVTLTAGTLNINSATALGATASALNINGGTIDNTSGSAKTLANNNTITLGGSFAFGTSAGTAANNLNLGTGIVNIGGSRTITLNGAGALTFGGVLTNTVNSNGNVTVTNGSGTTATSAVSFGGLSISASGDAANRAFYFYGDGNINFTGAIVNGAGTGTGTLQCSNTGTLTLTGANTYTGATAINSGVLDAIDGTGLPTLTALQLKGGVFQSSGTFTRLLNTGNGKFNFGGAGGTGSSGGFAARGGVLNLQINNGTSSLMWGNASTQVAGDGFSLIFGSSTADNLVDFKNGLNLGNGTVATRTITVIDNPNSSADIARISGNITETTVGMGLLKDGTGTLELSGNNTYTGATTINAGTLQIGAGGTSGAISSTSGITNNGTLAINRSDALTVSTVISGTGALTKNGSGTLTLTGNNTYTGATTVNAGTLQAAATRALGNSTVINVNGGSFLVTAENAVNDTAAINLGGGRMAVSGTFNETVGLLTLSANSTIDLAGYNGTLRFSGVGSWAAGTNLAIWNWNGINKYGTPVGDGLNNRHVVFTDATGLDSYLDRISFYSGSGTGFSGSGFAQGFSGGGTEIIAVPETETYFYAVALLAGVVVQYLRRRARRKLLKSHRPA